MTRLPLILKLAFLAWLLVWVPAYGLMHGPANFLWFCDLANFIIAVALWRESSLLLSSQAVGVLLIQLVWSFDFLVALFLRFHPIGGTEYMFDAGEPLWLRLLSLFHLAVPVLLYWGLRRLGYDRRGFWLQSAIAWLVLPLCFFITEPSLNINWLHGPFGMKQTLVAPELYLLFCLLAYPLVIYLPSHLALAAWFRRRSPPVPA